MTEEELQTVALSISAKADDLLLSLTDPDTYNQQKFYEEHAKVRAEAETLVGLGYLASSELTKLDQIRDLQYEYLFPIVSTSAQKVFADLGVPLGSGPVLWTSSQTVELTRNGEPWCTWEDAEEMLVYAALSIIRYYPVVFYSSVRDEVLMKLTLNLHGT